MRFKTILPEQAGAGTSSVISVDDGAAVSLMFGGSGEPTDAETAYLQHTTDDGTTWEVTYDAGAIVEIIEASQSIITIRGPGKYRVVKNVTSDVRSIVAAYGD